MITLTDAAVSEIKKVIEATAECNEYSCLRVSIEGGGCSGFQYRLGFIEPEGYDPKQDTKYKQDGITIVIEKNLIYT